MVDTETGGPTPRYPLLSIGACVQEHPDIRFYVELKPVSEKPALEKNVQVAWPNIPAAVTLDRLSREGIEPQVAMESFGDWVRTVSEGQRPVLLAYNVAFDWQFLNDYFHLYVGSNPFGIGGMDLPSYWAGTTGGPYLDSRRSLLPPELRVGLPPSNHNALQDAVTQSELLRRMRADGVRAPRAAPLSVTQRTQGLA